MNFSKYILALNLLLLSTAGLASQTHFKNDSDFLASVADANANQSRVAKGDLNRDGRGDFAILLVSGEDLSDRSQRLVVLVQDADGLYSVAASSATTQSAGMGCCRLSLHCFG